MALKINDLLLLACGHGASDLHLKAGSFPVMRIGGELHRDVAWTYRFPIPQLPRIAGLLAFRDELVCELRAQTGEGR